MYLLAMHTSCMQHAAKSKQAEASAAGKLHSLTPCRFETGILISRLLLCRNSIHDEKEYRLGQTTPCLPRSALQSPKKTEKHRALGSTETKTKQKQTKHKTAIQHLHHGRHQQPLQPSIQQHHNLCCLIFIITAHHFNLTNPSTPSTPPPQPTLPQRCPHSFLRTTKIIHH